MKHKRTPQPWQSTNSDNCLQIQTSMSEIYFRHWRLNLRHSTIWILLKIILNRSKVNLYCNFEKHDLSELSHNNCTIRFHDWETRILWLDKWHNLSWCLKIAHILIDMLISWHTDLLDKNNGIYEQQFSEHKPASASYIWTIKSCDIR